MPPKIKLIFNPIANLGRAWPVAQALRPIVDEFGGADWAGTVYPTHAAQLALQAAREGYDWVVALGGDGTVHEVINGLMQAPPERRPHLGVVPVGSGNDFAYSLGISRSPETALRQMLNGQHRPLDIGVLQDNLGRKEYWMNTLGIGFDAVIDIRSRKVPIIQGFAVYFAAVLQSILLNYRPFELEIEMDGVRFVRTLLMLIVANGKREGGGFLVAPDARLDDGLFEYNAVGRISRPRMLLTIPYFLKGTQAGLRYVQTGQVHKLNLKASRPLQIHIDGEVFAGFNSQTTSLCTELIHNELIAIYAN